MSARRTCRACGCWELGACEGGCSWIAADRCSACPDAPLTLPINAAHVAAARFNLSLDPSLQVGAEFVVMQCVEYPQLIVSGNMSKGHEDDRHLYVGALEVRWGDLEQAAELLNARAVAA